MWSPPPPSLHPTHARARVCVDCPTTCRCALCSFMVLVLGFWVGKHTHQMRGCHRWPCCKAQTCWRVGPVTGWCGSGRSIQRIRPWSRWLPHRRSVSRVLLRCRGSMHTDFGFWTFVCLCVCLFWLPQEGFTNGLAFATSGRFVAAAVGRVGGRSITRQRWPPHPHTRTSTNTHCLLTRFFVCVCCFGSQEHRLGRWWLNRKTHNGLRIISLPSEVSM